MRTPEYYKARQEAVRVWDKAHRCCPVCHSSKIFLTLIGIEWIFGTLYEDKKNNARCSNCRWDGLPEELVPAEILK